MRRVSPSGRPVSGRIHMKSHTPRRAVHGILLLDKPLGLSSNDALQAVKRLYAADKAGHTGSLDPLATGMLPICFGATTRLCGQLLDSDKRYLARGRFGQRTSTGDAEGAVVEERPARALAADEWSRLLAGFTGAIEQIPPMYSALKQEGRRLYELARRGIEVERPARSVRILDLHLLRADGLDFELDVRCSKGTYVRTLVEDIARAAGQCAHLTGLRRLEAGPFVSGMHSLDQVARAAELGPGALDGLLLDAGAALPGMPRVTVDGVRARRLRQGLAQQVAGTPRECRVLVCDDSGRALCLADSDAQGLVAPKAWLASSS
jgi:tRNA pseudouridine55 synthase